MTKIKSYTPGWLSRPSQGFQVFNTSQSASTTRQSQYREADDDHLGPNRTIAQRGTEIFVAAGNRIRWADLVLLKENYDEQLRTPSRKPKSNTESGNVGQGDNGPEDASYRVLNPSIGETIRQLSVSPNGSLLAIATSHTVHIAVLPDSSHLGQIPNKSINLKTFNVGPTIHVLSQSQVRNILWHPCGAGGSCLVTVTAEAAVRLWEFNSRDRSSVGNPSLAVDLNRLREGLHSEQDFTPIDPLRNRSFSSDNVDMEVASACFGGTCSEKESGWSSMTLWIAMRTGDIYALCPLLPTKWQPSATTIPQILAAIAVEGKSHEEGESTDQDLERQQRDKFKWIEQIDDQNPRLLDPDDRFSPVIYTRPPHPGPVPRLQGPLRLFAEDKEEDLDLSDIYVVPSKGDAANFIDGYDSDSEVDEPDESGLSASIIALVTMSGTLYVCLDLEGIEGQWLPPKALRALEYVSSEQYLVALEALETMAPSEQDDLQWPTFSYDAKSSYTLYATHNYGVYSFSFEPWITNLEKELQNSEKLGAPVRIGLIKDGPGTLRERVLSFHDEEDPVAIPAVSTCLSFLDSDIGYFLLTAVDGHPAAVTFDLDYGLREQPGDDENKEMPDMSLLTLNPARTTYQPAEAFYAESSLPRFLEKHAHSRHKRMMKEEVRLSTATLDLMTQAHRVLSQETHRLEMAASELFRRCDRLRNELADQLARLNNCAYRIEKVIGDDADPYLDSIRSKEPATAADRLDKARSTQEELLGRYETLRKKVGRVSGKALSAKEQSWISEVDELRREITIPRKNNTKEADEGEDGQEQGSEDEEQEGEDGVESAHEESALTLWRRCVEVSNWRTQLLDRTQHISSTNNHQPPTAEENNNLYTIPHGIRRSKFIAVKKLLERQTSMVEEAQLRLQHLSGLAV